MRFLTILLIASLSYSYACEPVELVEYRAQLHKACLDNSVPEYTCNKELMELRMMEQDAQIKMNWIKALNKHKTKITTLKLEK